MNSVPTASTTPMGYPTPCVAGRPDGAPTA